MMLVESGFVVLTALLLVSMLLGAAFVDAAGVDEHTAEIDADVPDVTAFEPTDEPGVATVDGDQYNSVQDAVDAADPGDTVTLEGRFAERVTVETADVTITSADELAVIDGGFGDEDADGGTNGEPGEPDETDVAGDDLDDHVEEPDADGASDETVVEIDADGVTLDRVWIRNSGYSATAQDAGVFTNGSNVTIVDSRITDVTFGIWVNAVEGNEFRNNTIVGHEDVDVKAQRGNGIHLYQDDETVIEDNLITNVRDGIYFSFSSEVLATGNTFWDSRFGVHYMYSDDCTLSDNLAFDNDVGYALMVSKNLEILDNVAVDNRGPGGQGILVLQIDDSTIEGNEVVGNDYGFHVDNSQQISLVDNLVLENEVGISVTAGSTLDPVEGNSFVYNERPVVTPLRAQLVWNGNYWSGANVADLTGDGTSEVRYQPEGLVETLIYENPEVVVFTESPAFDAVRIAESSFPVIEAPGVVDERPIVESNHDWWRYYAN